MFDELLLLGQQQMKTFGIAFVLLSFCAPVFWPGTSEGQTVRCESLTDSAKRLACFDSKTREQERVGKYDDACAILYGYATAPDASNIRNKSNFST